LEKEKRSSGSNHGKGGKGGCFFLFRNRSAGGKKSLAGGEKKTASQKGFKKGKRGERVRLGVLLSHRKSDRWGKKGRGILVFTPGEKHSTL